MLAARCKLPGDERGWRDVALRPETCTMLVWLLLLLYPSLAKMALTPFDCQAVGGRRLLRANPAVSCEDDNWRLLAFLGGLGAETSKKCPVCDRYGPSARQGHNWLLGSNGPIGWIGPVAAAPALRLARLPWTQALRSTRSAFRCCAMP